MSSDEYADCYKRIEVGERTIMTVRASSPDWFAVWVETPGGGQHMTTIYLRRRQLRELASALRWMDARMPLPEVVEVAHD